MQYDQSTKKKCMEIIRDYARDPRAGILFCGFYPRQLMWLALKLRNSACVKMFYSDSNIVSQGPFSPVRTMVYRFILKGFHTFLVIGTYNALFIRQVLKHSCFQTKRIVHFPYPHDHSAFVNNRRPFEAGKPVSFLYLGRLTPEKNVASICRACRILLDEGFTRFTLTIAGDGPESGAISEIMNTESLSGVISLIGPIRSKETPGVYCQHDIFILPSHYEPWGVVVNEALSSGLPVIAPIWAGAAADLIINGHNGIRLNSVTPESIAEAMKFYIKNPDLIPSQSCNAVRQVLQSKATVLDSLESLKSLFGK
jgi:glycosyltransferase involved in cell wall biosynthesis